MKISLRFYRVYYNFVPINLMGYGSGTGECYDADCSEKVREEFLGLYNLVPAERVVVIDEGISFDDPQ
jgi:hypothetical protein